MTVWVLSREAFKYIEGGAVVFGVFSSAENAVKTMWDVPTRLSEWNIDEFGDYTYVTKHYRWNIVSYPFDVLA